MTELISVERYWIEHQPWLLSLGYQLRPRFRQGWVPSWVTRPVEHYGQMWDREDFITHGINPVMDAIRLIDNKAVMMKRIFSRASNMNFEHYISEYVSSPEQLGDPDNISVHIIEILQVPGDDKHVILVMPLLRKWVSPRFDTIGEALDMIRQAFKGLQYLHRNRIAHRDCTGSNFMMDGSEMYPHGFHPVKQDYNPEFAGSAVQRYTRTQRPPRYYWIDFGLAIPFDKSNDAPRAEPVYAGDKSPPELQCFVKIRGRYVSLDPFPTDIYYLGNMLRMFFTGGSPDESNEISKRKLGFEFLKPLIEVMVQDDPINRPTIDQCVIQLDQIIRSQPSWTLRSQVWHVSDNALGFIFRFFPHWARRIVYIITQTQAIPSRDRKPPSPYLRLYTHILLALWIIIPLVLRYYPGHVGGP